VAQLLLLMYSIGEGCGALLRIAHLLQPYVNALSACLLMCCSRAQALCLFK
jgi:hypothetical protein